jgi:histidine phosphotransferase ChpT
MNMNYSLGFFEQLMVKFCHDLAGPIGAVANGLELMEDLGENVESEIFKLVRQSSSTVSHRLRYFRMAYGVIGADDQMVGLGEIRPVVENYYSGEKLQFTWGIDPNLSSLPVSAVKLILNLLLVANGCLLRAGEIVLGLEKHGGDQLVITLTIQGPGVLIPPHYAQVWNDQASGSLDQKSVQALFIKHLAHQYNAKFTYHLLKEGEGDRLTAPTHQFDKSEAVRLQLTLAAVAD